MGAEQSCCGRDLNKIGQRSKGEKQSDLNEAWREGRLKVGQKSVVCPVTSCSLRGCWRKEINFSPDGLWTRGSRRGVPRRPPAQEVRIEQPSSAPYTPPAPQLFSAASRTRLGTVNLSPQLSSPAAPVLVDYASPQQIVIDTPPKARSLASLFPLTLRDGRRKRSKTPKRDSLGEDLLALKKSLNNVDAPSEEETRRLERWEERVASALKSASDSPPPHISLLSQEKAEGQLDDLKRKVIKLKSTDHSTSSESDEVQAARKELGNAVARVAGLRVELRKAESSTAKKARAQEKREKFIQQVQEG
ncbi:hypothetical protein GUITHDRAFT_136724 [Guillardia theta CCMP2712]|uniref:Uncharacterized protein n=1 Tax=Guillardia theta (strain CCMP2712) TaxID=905079 RepID=L1JJW7_GUITC|nr:hypothetical protein GUITHDRAFT_136724 [Guillardia theta CCMP2712]EKX48632.1 hypothetical protein GUITHDRAFT_136724 [Guillardia theta CCMP2712]|eukprot:XP_005835612.1 hypothetical protein GUITHDRAFT_136724 [Guillardia theta CCMP2712]